MQNTSKAKILFIEDELEIRRNMSEILRLEGFDVEEADNGKGGLEKFLQNDFDLIISDIMMPEVDGYKLLENIRGSNHKNSKKIPFIFLTALSTKENVIKAIDLSANDYLSKPVDFDLMIAKIKEKINHIKAMDEIYAGNIQNVKSSLSYILPEEIEKNLNIILQISSSLKQEPYGPLPHRYYLKDFEKIFNACSKIRYDISQSLNESVINYKLNELEEVVNVSFFSNHIKNITLNTLGSKVVFDSSFDDKNGYQIKIDSSLFVQALDVIFSDLNKISNNIKSIQMNYIVDQASQVVMVAYVEFIKKSNLTKVFLEKKINNILKKQDCSFEIFEKENNAFVINIPSYRMMKKGISFNE